MEAASLTSRSLPAPTLPRARRRGGPRAVVRACSLVVVVLVGLLGSAAPASAHADLVSSSPGDQEQLQQSPPAVTLTFSQPVGDQFASVTVTGPDGQTWQDGDAQVSGESVVQPLRALTATGSYRADWRVVADDGHALEGTVSFAFTALDGDGSAAVAPEEPLPGASEEPAPPVDDVDAQPTASTEDAGTGPNPVIIVAVLAGAAVLVLGGAALVRRRARSAQPRA